MINKGSWFIAHTIGLIDYLFSLAYTILISDTEILQYGFVQLVSNADGVFSSFNQNQGNSADPGGPLIVLKNDIPIIYG